MNIKRITSQYVVAEDRLRVAGVAEDGRALTLWLTQRLLNKLVATLCRGLEKHNGHSQNAGASQGLRSHVEQSFAQQRAMANFAYSAPVIAPVDSPQWRVDAADIAQGAGGVRLTFKGSEDSQRAELTLSAPDLRQWLTIVFSQYKRAEWPTHVWPDWMEESTQGRRSHSLALH